MSTAPRRGDFRRASSSPPGSLPCLRLKRQVARRYEAGDLSLRDAADLLGLSTREALEAIGQAGVRGGFHLDTDLRLLDAARAGRRGRSRPAR